jgi:hypothetical protein
MANLPDSAAELCHALNNVASSIFAGLSYLEDAGDGVAVGRARRSLERASASCRALSAAAYLLSLTEDDVRCAVDQPSMGCVLDARAFASIVEFLEEVAGVRTQSIWPRGLRVTLAVDADTLQSLLMCAAFRMRKESAIDAKLVLEIAELPSAGAAEASLSLRIAVLDAPDGSQVSIGSSHPCATALGHASAVLPRALASTERSIGADWQIRLPVSLVEGIAERPDAPA